MKYPWKALGIVLLRSLTFWGKFLLLLAAVALVVLYVPTWLWYTVLGLVAVVLVAAVLLFKVIEADEALQAEDEAETPPNFTHGVLFAGDVPVGTFTLPPTAEFQGEHVLYSNDDDWAPTSICDQNGDVVLALCKICGQAESELDGTPCPGFTYRTIPARDVPTQKDLKP